jgi:aspartate aminotransferase
MIQDPDSYRTFLGPDGRSYKTVTQIVNGWAFTSALMQHSLPDLEKLCIDIEQLHHKRNWLVHELGDMGYGVGMPEGTFYLLVKSPLEDDIAFTNLLAEKGIFCLPGSTAEIPGYFRISLTANEEMIRRSIPGFAAAIDEAANVPGTSHVPGT